MASFSVVTLLEQSVKEPWNQNIACSKSTQRYKEITVTVQSALLDKPLLNMNTKQFSLYGTTLSRL